MKLLFYFILFNILASTTYCQVSNLTDTIKYELIGKTKKDCVNKLKEKISKLGVSDTLSISESEDNDVFIGKGKFTYNHIINYDTSDAFLNRTYVGQVIGFVTYKVRIEFQKKYILVALQNFEHVAKGSKYGKKSLGMINFAYVPNKSKDEELIWLDKVLKDILGTCKRVNVGFKLWFFNTML